MTERIPIPQGVRPTAIRWPVAHGSYSVYLDWSADAPRITGASYRALNDPTSQTVWPETLALAWVPDPPPYQQGLNAAGGLWISYLRR
jgi:hypothetical protein